MDKKGIRLTKELLDAALAGGTILGGGETVEDKQSDPRWRFTREQVIANVFQLDPVRLSLCGSNQRCDLLG